MTIIFFIGISIAIICGLCLIRIGFKGCYIYDFMKSILYQLFFIGSLSLLLYSTSKFQIKYIIGVVLISFLFPVVGDLIYISPISYFTESEKDRLNRVIYRSIKRSRKYRDYISFINRNAHQIAAISKDGQVVYAPDGVPLFTKRYDRSEYIIEWNPALGHPVYPYFENNHTKEWLIKKFFWVESNERKWKKSELKLLKELIYESLPGRTDQWVYDRDYGYYFRTIPIKLIEKRGKSPY